MTSEPFPERRDLIAMQEESHTTGGEYNDRQQEKKAPIALDLNAKESQMTCYSAACGRHCKNCACPHIARRQQQYGRKQLQNSCANAPRDLKRADRYKWKEGVEEGPKFGKDINRLRRGCEFEEECLQEDDGGNDSANPTEN